MSVITTASLRVGSFTLFSGLSIFCIACLLVGCSRGEAITKAGGIVKYGGEPLETGSVEFYPVSGGRTARAVIGADGSFTVSYRKPGDGLPPGDYKVAVISVKSKRSEKAAPPSESGQAYDDEQIFDFGGPTINVVPTIYNDITTTPLRQTVTEDSPQFLEIDIPKK